MTPAEKALWRELRRFPIGPSHWRKQAPVGPFIVDFICHGAKLVVELEGGVHYAPGAAERDDERREFLEGRGYDVLRFKNAEIKADIGLVVRTILATVE